MSTSTLQVAEDLSALAVEQQVLGKEIGKLKKMINLGFEGKLIGADKVTKAYGSNDNEQIQKFYELVAGFIKTAVYLGNKEKLADYLAINHSITLDCTSKPIYQGKPKKKQKFNDLYNEYFMEPAPKGALDAMTKILNSLSANYKELIDENVKLKEEFEAVVDTVSDTPRTLKTLTRMLTRAKVKDIEVAEVADELEAKSQEDEIAINLIRGAEEDE
jgi:hypothetical protein